MSDEDEPIPEGSFRCHMCQRVFKMPPDWTHEDALDEADAAGIADKACALVCEDCYQLSQNDELSNYDG